MEVDYIQNPTDNRLQNLKTYFVHFEKNVENKETISKAIDLPGFVATNDKALADFVINVSEVDFNCTTPVISRRLEKTRPVQGKQGFVATNRYMSRLSVTYNVSILLKNDSLLSVNTGKSEKKISVSERTPTGTRHVYNKTLKDGQNEVRLEAFNKAFTAMKETYCFVNKSVGSSFLSFAYKNFDYKTLNEMAKKGNELIKKQNKENRGTFLKEYILTLEGELKNYDFSQKKTRINSKLKFGLLYNISLCYFHLNDFEEALNYLDLTSNIDEKVQLNQSDLVRICKRNLKYKTNE